MEDKLGDYLYLIIIVITFVVSLLKNIGKKKGEKESTTHQSNMPNEPQDTYMIDDPDPDWDDYEDEVPEQPQPLVPFAEAISQMQYQPMTHTQPKSSMRAEAEGGRNVMHQAEKRKQKEAIVDDNSYVITDADDMRRAFVMSEIFNRKY